MCRFCYVILFEREEKQVIIRLGMCVVCEANPPASRNHELILRGRVNEMTLIKCRKAPRHVSDCH
jgi:hypothetical protein